MLHNEALNLLVEACEKTHDARGIALAYGVSVPTVYQLAEIVDKLNLPVGIEMVRQGIQAMGVPTQKEDDPRFGTEESPMRGQRETSGIGLRRKHRRLIWFFWMKGV